MSAPIRSRMTPIVEIVELWYVKLSFPISNRILAGSQHGRVTKMTYSAMNPKASIVLVGPAAADMAGESAQLQVYVPTSKVMYHHVGAVVAP